MARKVTDLNEIRQAAARAAEGERLKFEKPKTSDSPLAPADVWKAVTSGQDGDAWLFVQLHRDRLCFDHAAGRWYLFDEHWREARIEEPIAMLDEVIRAYETEACKCSQPREDAGTADPAPEPRQAKRGRPRKEEGEDSGAIVRQKVYRKKIGKLQVMGWKSGVLTRATAGAGSLGITGDEWDAQPWWIGCVNGVLELRPFRFRPGCLGDYIKTICPTRWEGLDMPAPAWERFLLEVFGGDLDLVGYLQRLLGSALVGTVLDHIIPIFHGEGRNGKGTLFETLGAVLGPLAGPIQSEMLLEQKYGRPSGGPTSDIMALRGKRLVWASETDEGRKLNVGRVKWLCGGDTFVGREPYGKREVSFKPSHTLFLFTNHKPRTDARDFALWQRIHLVPFKFRFVDKPVEEFDRRRDRHLLERLMAETSGILAWLVRGCLEWQRKELSPPEVVLQATAKYRQDEDVINHFLNECCYLAETAEVRAGKLYQAYKSWCQDNGEKAESGTKFGKVIKCRFDSYSYQCVFYKGIGLKDAN